MHSSALQGDNNLENNRYAHLTVNQVSHRGEELAISSILPPHGVELVLIEHRPASNSVLMEAVGLSI
ncbi:hypothetical protein C9I89_13335 [Photobacterium lipolyticum]|uniref:Uncharacterized protein n=1 Tax=Photobacterium lipolyticum TaxID=266810 RepID=A0A2T3MWN6_9GAMM|nr:hypothetical protein C9I89_13335 [Photobacterium lipolyticum]